MKKVLVAGCILFSKTIVAQDSIPVITFSGYVEAYYQYDFNRPADHNRPAFVYSHNRHNEFNVNIAFLKASYSTSRIRSNVAIATGSYMNANYAAEPGVLKNIYEANAGLRLGKQNLWIDAGIFSSHIGFESAVSKDCWNLTRSMLADNSPYFESGAKITWTSSNEKWLLSALALNGWQRITRVNGSSRLSWGTQVQYRPSANVTLNSGTFIGTDKPDSARLNRFFHNFYGIFILSPKIALTTGFDYGIEQRTKGINTRNKWYSPVIIAKYTPFSKWAFALRGEYYSDASGLIVAVPAPGGFKVTGYSFNIDHYPAKNAVVRIEARNLHGKDAVFAKGSSFVKNDFFITSSIAISF